MIKMYEKTEKSINNLHGVIEINDGINPILAGPCMICLAAQEKVPTSVFGMIREGMQAARLRTSVDPAARYSTENFPVKFLGMSYSKDNEESSFSEEIANKYLIPLIKDNGKRVSLEEAMKNMRNLTIMTYCDGTYTYLNAEVTLIEEMKKLDYSDEEIKQIVSQICLLPIQTDCNIGHSLATTMQFCDTNDKEVYTTLTKALEKSLEQDKLGHRLGTFSKNAGIYYYNGSGNHSIKAYFTKDNLAYAVLSSVVVTALENSIENHNREDSFSPLTINTLLNSASLVIQKARARMTTEEIIALLDESISYPGATILSEQECKLLSQIDEMAKK